MKKELEIVLNPQHIELEGIVGLDLETSGLQAWEERIRLLIISTSRHIYILDVDKYTKAYLTEVMWSLSSCDVVVAHNAKFDCGFLYFHYGVLLKNWHCTQIASQICTNGKREFRGRHSLPEVIERYLGVKLTFIEKNKKLLQKSFTSQYTLSSFTSKQLKYASEDVQYLIPLYTVQCRHIENLMLKPIAAIEFPLIHVLAKMEMEGCLIDAVGWRGLIKEYWEPDVERIELQLDEELKKLIPTYNGRRKANFESPTLFGDVIQRNISFGGVNYASSEQVIGIFNTLGEEVPQVKIEEKQEEDGRDGDSTDIFTGGTLGLWDTFCPEGPEEVEKKESKDSLDEGVLTTYINERPNSRMKPFILKLIEYRVASKRVSTYGEKFLARLDKSSFIHTGYTQTFTETGRLSSKAPNLQNIPAPEKGKPHTDIRRFFKARPGYKLITCDMAGAEVAIAADYSQEPLLLASLREGVDMHSMLASVSFSIICGQEIAVSKSEVPIEVKGHTLIPVTLRDLHKSVVFAKFYKGGAARVYGVLAEYINMFHSEDMRMAIAQQISKALDLKMPKLSEYLTGLINKAHKEGYLRGSKLGRIRYFDENAYGECANFPIQNSNAEALKMAMIELFLYFETCGFDGRIVMNIHDEIVCEVEEKYAEEAAPIIKDIVAKNLSYFLKTINGGASVEISNYWKK